MLMILPIVITLLTAQVLWDSSTTFVKVLPTTDRKVREIIMFNSFIRSASAYFEDSASSYVVRMTLITFYRVATILR